MERAERWVIASLATVPRTGKVKTRLCPSPAFEEAVDLRFFARPRI